MLCIRTCKLRWRAPQGTQLFFAHSVIGQQLYPLRPAMGTKKCRDALHLLHAVVDPCHYRDTDPNSLTAVQQPSQIVQNQFVANTCVAPMLLSVHALDVVEEQVRDRQDTFEYSPIHMAGRVYRRMDALLSTALKDLNNHVLTYSPGLW